MKYLEKENYSIRIKLLKIYTENYQFLYFVFIYIIIYIIIIYIPII